MFFFIGKITSDEKNGLWVTMGINEDAKFKNSLHYELNYVRDEDKIELCIDIERSPRVKGNYEKEKNETFKKVRSKLGNKYSIIEDWNYGSRIIKLAAVTNVEMKLVNNELMQALIDLISEGVTETRHLLPKLRC